MKKIAILSLSLVMGVVTAMATGNFIMSKRQPTITVQAQWKNIYKTAGGLVAGADLVVEAEHIMAMPGRVVGEGEDATPFTDNTFAVSRILKGVHEGNELIIEQTGGLMGNGQVLNINDGGPYRSGAGYLLFLKSTGDGKYYLINHQARYEIKDGMLEGVDPTDPVVASMHMRTLDAGRTLVRKRARLVE
jgi:hypothetical protein